MTRSLSKPAKKLTLLSLPDDVLVKVFKQITDTTMYTLHSSKDAVNLAHTNTRLHRIFGAQLTHITPIIDSREADTLSPQHFKALLQIAGANLRELYIPNCSYDFVNELPDLCPNLEALHFVEGYHYPAEFASRGSDEQNDDDNESKNGPANNEIGTADTNGNDTGGSKTGDCNAGDSSARDNDTSKKGNSDDENSDNDKSNISEDNISDESDDDNSSIEISDSDYDFIEVPPKCPAFDVLPRLHLRKLLVRDPGAFFNCIITTMANKLLQELHLFNVRKHRLPLLIPLLSLSLTSLTVTMDGSICDSYSEPVSEFIDALVPVVSRIASISIHIPSKAGLATYIECSVNTDSFDFPDHATSLIASARENVCQSQCMTVDLAGEVTFQILSVVNRNASITLSNDRITLSNHGQGTYITSLPLYTEFLGMDITHLEKAYILQRWYAEGDDLMEYQWDEEWGRILAGHRLRLIRTYDARVLNKLELSTEIIELFYTAVPSVDDWSFLMSVRELYLLGSPDDFGNDDGCATIAPVIQALPDLVDAFHGEFIWTSSYNPADCSECSSPENVLEDAKKTKDAIDRFLKRGGDAATLQAYVEMLLTKLEECIMMRSQDLSFSDVDQDTVVANNFL